jgi:hypothetical protein
MYEINLNKGVCVIPNLAEARDLLTAIVRFLATPGMTIM